jgi:hypothetical protein
MVMLFGTFCVVGAEPVKDFVLMMGVDEVNAALPLRLRRADGSMSGMIEDVGDQSRSVRGSSGFDELNESKLEPHLGPRRLQNSSIISSMQNG